MTLVLRELTPDDEAAFHAAVKGFGDPDFEFALGYSADMPFDRYLRALARIRDGVDLPAGFVPATLWFGFAGDVIIGRLSFRHRLNDHLLREGGHIGYGTVAAYRRQGYGLGMLRLALPRAKAMGLDRVLITCDDTNLGSRAIIEHCGGVLENIVPGSGKSAAPKRRYWIAL